MIFEVVLYRATLLGAAGRRIVNIDLGTRACKGFVSADNEVEAARKVGLIKLALEGCEESLREWIGRYWFPHGTQVKAVMAEWQKTGDRTFDRGEVLVFVVSAVIEITANYFARG